MWRPWHVRCELMEPGFGHRDCRICWMSGGGGSKESLSCAATWRLCTLFSAFSVQRIEVGSDPGRPGPKSPKSGRICDDLSRNRANFGRNRRNSAKNWRTSSQLQSKSLVDRARNLDENGQIAGQIWPNQGQICPPEPGPNSVEIGPMLAEVKPSLVDFAQGCSNSDPGRAGSGQIRQQVEDNVPSKGWPRKLKTISDVNPEYDFLLRGASIAGPKFDQPKIRSKMVARPFPFSGAGFGRRTDFRGLDAIRRIASGPRESAARPKSASPKSQPSASTFGRIPGCQDFGASNDRILWPATPRHPMSIVDAAAI